MSSAVLQLWERLRLAPLQRLLWMPRCAFFLCLFLLSLPWLLTSLSAVAKVWGTSPKVGWERCHKPLHCPRLVLLGDPNLATAVLVLLVSLQMESVLRELAHTHLVRPRNVNLKIVGHTLEVLASAVHLLRGRMAAQSRW